MRILVVTIDLPYPPASGGAIRVNGIVEGLHRAGHEVTLLCFHKDPQAAQEAAPHIHIETVTPFHRATGKRLRDLLLTRQPDIAGRFYSEAFEARLRELLAQTQFDLIQFEGIESVCYLPIARQVQPEARLIFDTFNAEYALQRGIYEIDRQNIKRWPAALYSFLQVGRIAHFERQMCQLADVVIAVSPEDAELLRPFRPDGCIHVVPNGIWTDNYTTPAQSAPPTLSENAIVFTGKMDYRPNVDAMLWFTDEVLPRIRAQMPDVYLYIVGQQPHPRLDHLREINGVTITGRVESVLPYLHGASVYVAPLRMGSGTRLKLLEAMACGCAIVATSTAGAGLLPEAKQAMLIADDNQEMAAQILTLLQDHTRRQEMGNTAQIQVKQHYDWSVLIPRLLDAYQTAKPGVHGG